MRAPAGLAATSGLLAGASVLFAWFGKKKKTRAVFGDAVINQWAKDKLQFPWFLLAPVLFCPPAFSSSSAESAKPPLAPQHTLAATLYLPSHLSNKLAHDSLELWVMALRPPAAPSLIRSKPHHHQWRRTNRHQVLDETTVPVCLPNS
jgi:hypothetical protein